MSAPATSAERRAQVERLATLRASDRVRDGSRITRDTSERAQVCVVGTGAGGAPLAYELARRGHSVVLLEEGPYLLGRDRDGSPTTTRDEILRESGGLGVDDGDRIALPHACVVGGNTALGYGTVVRAPDDVLASWRSEGAVVGLGPEELAPYYERLERDLGVAPPADATLGSQALLAERGARRLGWPGARVQRAARGCLATGICGLGCPNDAVQGTQVAHLPGALDSGAVLYTRARAVKVLVEAGRAFGVVADLLDANGKPGGHTLRVVADRIVLACGALGTPALLSRSEVDSGSGHLGMHLRVRPWIRLLGRFDEEVRAWAEVPQSFAVDLGGDRPVRLETSFAPPAVLAAEAADRGVSSRAALARYASLVGVAATITEAAEGELRFGGEVRPTIRHHLDAADHVQLRFAAARAAELLLAAGAREVFTGIAAAPLLRSPADLAVLEAADADPSDLALHAHHAQGTARMCDDPRRGVTASSGQVHGVRDLYVCDASILPAPLPVPPQHTIMALSLRMGEGLAAGLGAPF